MADSPTPDVSLREKAALTNGGEIVRRVEESRVLRSDAGYELIGVTGSARSEGVLTIDARFPLLAKCMEHQHDHVRWANETLITLLEERDAALSRVERAEADSKRLATLWRELDGQGSLTLTVWAGSEQVCIDELEIDIGPRESLTALLDAVGEFHDEVDDSDAEGEDATPEAPNAL